MCTAKTLGHFLVPLKAKAFLCLRSDLIRMAFLQYVVFVLPGLYSSTVLFNPIVGPLRNRKGQSKQLHLRRRAYKYCKWCGVQSGFLTFDSVWLGPRAQKKQIGYFSEMLHLAESWTRLKDKWNVLNGDTLNTAQISAWRKGRKNYNYKGKRSHIQSRCRNITNNSVLRVFLLEIMWERIFSHCFQSKCYKNAHLIASILRAF